MVRTSTHATHPNFFVASEALSQPLVDLPQVELAESGGELFVVEDALEDLVVGIMLVSLSGLTLPSSILPEKATRVLMM